MGLIDDDMEDGGDYLAYFSDRIVWKFGDVYPTSTFVEKGIITCPEHTGADSALTLIQLLPGEIFRGRQKPESPALFADQDVMGHFDQSRIPQRVAPRAPQERLEIEKEMPDLLKIEDGQTPADPKYRHLAGPLQGNITHPM